MGTRIATGVVLIALVLAWLFLADYPVFAIGALAIYAIGAKEMAPLLGFKSNLPFLLAAAVAASAAFYFAPPGLYVEGLIPLWVKILLIISLVFWCAMFPLVKIYPKDTSWHRNKALNTVIGLMLLVPFLLSVLILRSENYNTDYNSGACLLLAVMALVWAADSGAYFTGRAIGKTPMLPAVSPKKTMEGLYGGLALAFLVLVVLDYFGFYASFGDHKGALMAAGAAAIVFSVLGDLMESMLKRIVGVKDSGRIFPGHGGMLDRIDSELAALPVFLAVYMLLSGELL